MSRKLVITDGTRERELQLVGRLVVGRDPTCDISDDHSLLSRRHAEFVTSSDGVTIRDLGSRNGVFVNGSRAAERALEPGDIVQIGPLRARYVVDDAPLSITPEVLDGDRTVMLQKPVPSGTVGGTAPSPVAAVPTPSVLEETVVPFSHVDEDVTRMVPAPVAPAAAAAATVPAEEEVTRFTSAPKPPEFTVVLHQPAASSSTSPLNPSASSSASSSAVAAAAAESPAAAVLLRPAPRLPVAPPNLPTAGSGTGQVVLMHTVVLAGVAVIATIGAVSIVPGPAGVLLALVVAVAAAVLIAGIINRQVSAAFARAAQDRT